jgi:hypothetical protein
MKLTLAISTILLATTPSDALFGRKKYDNCLHCKRGARSFFSRREKVDICPGGNCGGMTGPMVGSSFGMIQPMPINMGSSFGMVPPMLPNMGSSFGMVPPMLPNMGSSFGMLPGSSFGMVAPMIPQYPAANFCGNPCATSFCPPCPPPRPQFKKVLRPVEVEQTFVEMVPVERTVKKIVQVEELVPIPQQQVVCTTTCTVATSTCTPCPNQVAPSLNHMAGSALTAGQIPIVMN